MKRAPNAFVAVRDLDDGRTVDLIVDPSDIYADDHWIVRKYPACFVTVAPNTETATAGPGEVRDSGRRR